MFYNSVGGPIEGQNLLRRSFQPLLAAAGCPPIDLHELRHSMATLLMESGVELRVVQALLRHETPTLTARVYQRAREAIQREMPRRLGDLLVGNGGWDDGPRQG